MSLNTLAARTIKRHAECDNDAQRLLDMLGLVDEYGNIKPDDTSVYHFSEPSAGPGAKNPDAPAVTTRERSGVTMTTPPGLATLSPAEPPVAKKRGPKPQPKVVRPRKKREVPECGTYKAYARHRRQGEPIDDACLEVSREYHRATQAEYRLRERRKKEHDRLIAEGVSPANAQVLVEAVL